jgi:predicted DNA-binding transcriptional regulator AlpA
MARRPDQTAAPPGRSLLREIEEDFHPGWGLRKSFSRGPALRSRVGGCSHATLYNWIAKGLWPQGISIGPNFVAWEDHETDVMIEAHSRDFTQEQLRQLVREIHERRTVGLAACRTLPWEWPFRGRSSANCCAKET